MRLCWDNLEGLDYVPDLGLWRKPRRVHRHKYDYYRLVTDHPCEWCGQPFLARVHAAPAPTPHFCSHRCRGRAKLGALAPRWKGGVTRVRDLIRSSQAYRSWRQVVLHRDNMTCQRCGRSGVPLHAHHICSFAYWPMFRFDPDNGITVCETCHRRYHAAIPSTQARRADPGLGRPRLAGSPPASG